MSNIVVSPQVPAPQPLGTFARAIIVETSGHIGWRTVDYAASLAIHAVMIAALSILPLFLLKQFHPYALTPILPRMSATLIEPRIERLLNKYEVELPELFHGECQLRDCLATRSLPAELKQDFEQTRLAVKSSMQRVSQSLQTLDPSLVEAASRAASKMHYQVNRLEKRAAQAELRRTDILSRHAAQIENALY